MLILFSKKHNYYQATISQMTKQKWSKLSQTTKSFRINVAKEWTVGKLFQGSISTTEIGWKDRH